MQRTKIIEILKTEPKGNKAMVCGWVRTFRNNQFVALSDGSTIKTLQLVLERESYDEIFLLSFLACDYDVTFQLIVWPRQRPWQNGTLPQLI